MKQKKQIQENGQVVKINNKGIGRVCWRISYLWRRARCNIQMEYAAQEHRIKIKERGVIIKRGSSWRKQFREQRMNSGYSRDINVSLNARLRITFTLWKLGVSKLRSGWNTDCKYSIHLCVALTKEIKWFYLNKTQFKWSLFPPMPLDLTVFSCFCKVWKKDFVNETNLCYQKAYIFHLNNFRNSFHIEMTKFMEFFVDCTGAHNRNMWLSSRLDCNEK